MPVRWNSTDSLLQSALHMEDAIRAVLSTQKWDKSVRDHLTPSPDDWKLLKEMAIFFNLFRRPTVESQAEKYPTLHNTIPNYLLIMRQLNIWKDQDDELTLQSAAFATSKVITQYYNTAIKSRHSFVAIICDPRFKLASIAYLFKADGGSQSSVYNLAKAHFFTTYSQYQRRADGLALYERQ